MTNNVLVLEAFDDGAQSGAGGVQAQKKRTADYAAGYAAGEAAALAQASEQNEALQSAAQAIEAKLAAFDHEASNYLCETLAAAAAKIFPAIARDYFSHESVALLVDALGRIDPASIDVRISMDHEKAFRAALSQAGVTERVTLTADETQSKDRIDAQWAFGGFEFDLEKAIAAFIHNLKATTQESKGSEPYDQ